MLTKPCRRTRGKERGQMLIMALMLLVLLLGFGAIVVDVGFFLHRRERVQHVADAAALAGAQELPADRVLAEDIAREWADRNGLDGNTIDVSFECRPDSPCEPSGANTIKVTGEMRAPLTLMPVLKLLGGSSDSCWLNDGCDVAGTAAAEAVTAVAPTDIVLVLDRTGSMTNDCTDGQDNDGDHRIDYNDPQCQHGGLTEDGGPTDLEQVQEGALAMLGVLNPELQSVGLAVLPPSESQSFNGVCNPNDTLNNNEWGTWPDNWLVSNLAADYLRPNGSLNTSSRLVGIINCLQSEGYTNIGYPVRAAYGHLMDPNYARDEADKAIVLLSDGAANRPRGGNGDTGLRSPTAQAAVTSSSGDNNGYEVSPTSAFADGGDYARDMNSGTSTSTSCGDSGKDRHRFYNYGLSIPSGSTVTGIEVRLDARVDSSSGTNSMCVELSWNGGVTWTSAKSTGDINNSWTTRYLGGNTDNWGHTWTEGELANGNFMIRVTDAGSNGSRDFNLDWAAVRVHYSTIGNPCALAAQWADIAKAENIEIYTIGYGTNDNTDEGFTCANDTGAWEGQTAETLLRYMATDNDHFFQEPAGSDLTDVFQEIGQLLASGYRLVE